LVVLRDRYPGVYQVVIEYLDEEAGRYAARAAVRLCQSLVDTGRYLKQDLEQDLQDLKDLYRDAAWTQHRSDYQRS